jgi:hypothetical protein
MPRVLKVRPSNLPGPVLMLKNRHNAETRLGLISRGSGIRCQRSDRGGYNGRG